MAPQSVTFNEIRQMLNHFPNQSHQGCGGCDREKSSLTHAVDHLRAWQVNEEGTIKATRPRVCFFAASHGHDPKSVDEVKAWLEQPASGTSVVQQLCQLADAELRVYELDIENPTKDITSTAAMDEEEAARAITYGMMAVEPGLDLLILGCVGAGAEFSAHVVHAVLTGEGAEDTHLKKVLLAQNIQSKLDPLEVLRCLGGYDFCAMLGAAIAARMAGIPVFVDGLEGQVIKEVLMAMAPDAGGHIHFVRDDIFAGQPHRAIAMLPSLKAHLILNKNTPCGTHQSCQHRKVG